MAARALAINAARSTIMTTNRHVTSTISSESDIANSASRAIVTTSAKRRGRPPMCTLPNVDDSGSQTTVTTSAKRRGRPPIRTNPIVGNSASSTAVTTPMRTRGRTPIRTTPYDDKFCYDSTMKSHIRSNLYVVSERHVPQIGTSHKIWHLQNDYDNDLCRIREVNPAIQEDEELIEDVLSGVRNPNSQGASSEIERFVFESFYVNNKISEEDKARYREARRRREAENNANDNSNDSDSVQSL
ncbi:unnamed protein product [Caenorhabditis bovis]|uniref:Uncharacterized protein n=1 Tax=Caenorhabditis bovis TaxID=2654633 RepID=A0A8S1EGX4_9PELO|nr:unnamed protein product [Caenorhabditis bovis]